MAVLPGDASRSWRLRGILERRFELMLRSAGADLAERLLSKNSLDDVILYLDNLPERRTFQRFALMAARHMVIAVSRENAQTWKRAAHKTRLEKTIHQLLREELAGNERFEPLIEHNATMIRTLPLNVSNRLTQQIARATVQGQRTESIMNHIPDLLDWEARRLARTEVGKTQAAITQVRSEVVGIQWYIWQTSQDQRVRSSHAHMQGVACQYTNPPAPEVLNGEKSQGHYNAGEIYNCRCYAAPVIDTAYEAFPLRVVRGNTIARIPRAQFETML